MDFNNALGFVNVTEKQLQSIVIPLMFHCYLLYKLASQCYIKEHLNIMFDTFEWFSKLQVAKYYGCLLKSNLIKSTSISTDFCLWNLKLFGRSKRSTATTSGRAPHSLAFLSMCSLVELL